VQARTFTEVETPHGKVRIKVAGDGGYAPEYEDCPQTGARARHRVKTDYRGSKLRVHEIPMKYYLTTPIYYVNAAPHIGHAYTTIVADLYKRFKTMQGFDAVLTTGSDEHGVNVERPPSAPPASRHANSPMPFAAEFERQWKMLGLQIDHFQRTTSPQARPRGQRSLCAMAARTAPSTKAPTPANIASSTTSTSTMPSRATPAPIADAHRDHHRGEFLLQALGLPGRPAKALRTGTRFHPAETRRNEVISFVKAGLTDLSITRTNIKWGIPVDGEAPHVFTASVELVERYLFAAGGVGGAAWADAACGRWW